MEKVLNILAEYRSKGVRIGLDDQGINLSIKGNVVGLNDVDKQTLRDNKELLLDFLRNQRSIKIPSTPLKDGQKLPLSPSQKSIWLHARLEEDDTMYLIPFVYDLIIPFLDREQLYLATKKLIQEHKILSFVFREEQGDIVQQTADFNVSNHLFFEDLSAFPLDQRKGVFEKAIQQSMQEGFNFMDKAPWSITVFDFGDDNYSFFLKTHHLIADGSTLNLLVENLVDAYKTQVSGNLYKNQGIQYHDYLNWISNKEHQKQSSEFWKTYLENRSDDFQFYLTENIVEEGVSPLIDLKLSSSLSSDIDAFSKVNNVYVSHLFSFAFGFVLSKYGRTEDLILGTPVEGRSRPELTRVIGDLVNTLPLRLRLNYKQSIRENLSAFGKGFLSILEHQLYPLEYILDDINYDRRQNEFPLFNTMVSFPNNQELGARNENEIKIGKEKALYDLTLSVLQLENGIDLQLEFDTGKFSKTFVSNILNQTIIVLHQILQNPDGALTEVSLIRENEREAYLKAGLPHTEVKLKYNSALEAIEEKVNQTPQAIAILEGERSITYLELNKFSKSIAAKLQKEGIAKGDKIAVELPSGVNLIGCMLGIWAIGAVYVPLGTQLPQSRKEEIIQDCGAACCINDTFLSDLTAETPVEVINDSADVAYILYTSGSTGKPKGVVISHGALEAKMEEELELVKLDSIITLTLTSPSFDVSFLELLLPLVAGGRVVICEDKSNEKIYTLITDHGVTILQGTPTYFSHFESELGELASKLNRTLKRLCIGGESLNDVLVKRLKKKLPDVRVNNHYGPTEITIDALVKQDVSEFKRNSIGKPFGNTGAIITDDYYNVLPEFVPGELSITGPSLAEGYWNLETETKQKFNQISKLGVKSYRTGDIAIWTPTGEVEFIGRKDKQVKYRGYRIELEEISTRVEGLEKVKMAHTKVVKQLLVSWVVADNFSPSEALKSLNATLPDYMIPSVFLCVEKFPLTPNGKIDDKQLELLIEVSDENTLAETSSQVKLVEIWKEVLNTNQLRIDEHFFALGGNSLDAIKLLSRYKKAFGVELSLKDLYTSLTIRAHAELLEVTSQSHLEIPQAEEMEDYPLSASQKRLWIVTQIMENSAVYNMPETIVLDKHFDIDAMQKALAVVVKRHEILRTQFIQSEEGEARQKIIDHTNIELPVRIEDFTSLEHAEKEATVLIQKDEIRPFDLLEAPLFRVVFIKVNEEQYYFYFNMHHIIGDAWSMRILKEELMMCYEGIKNGKKLTLNPLPIQYKDYSVWQQQQVSSDDQKHQKDYWNSVLSKSLPQLNFPSTKKRPSIMTNSGQRLKMDLDQEAFNSLQSICKEQETTLFTGLLATWKVLVKRYTGQDDIITGTPVSGRSHTLLQEQIGFYVNSLALRCSVDSKSSFKAFLKDLDRKVQEAFKHQDYPFDLLIEELKLPRDTSRNAVFDTLFSVDFNEQLRSKNELVITPVDLGESYSKLDIEVMFEIGESFATMHLCFNPDVYEQELMEQLMKHFNSFLKQLELNGEQAIESINFLLPEEEAYVLDELNATRTEYPRKQSIIDLFYEVVADHADQTAIVYNEKVLSYKELNEKSNELASFLYHNYGVEEGNFVGINVERSEKFVVAMLAILKLGAAYVPLESSYPLTRIKAIEEDCKWSLCFSEKEYDVFKVHQGSKQIPKWGPEIKPTAKSRAYAIYTSGSTGKPKGVLVEHQSVVRLVKNTNYVNQNAGESVLGLSSFAFDGSIYDVFMPLLNGGKLLIATRDLLLDFNSLKEIIQNQQVTSAFVTTALFNALVEAKLDVIGNLKFLLFGGEMASVKHVQEFKILYPNVTLQHVYGPTENTTFSTYYTVENVDGNEKNIPIGRSISNSTSYILDENKNLLPLFVEGEIYLGGEGLSLGYLNAPELTSQKFIKSPFDSSKKLYKTGDRGRLLPHGVIEILGRVDDQVKIRGFRIELGEIEQWALRFPAVQEVCAVVRKTVSQQDALLLYYRSDQELEEKELKAFLSEKLPKFSIPDVFQYIEKFPLNQNGKIDKKKLPEFQLEVKQVEREFVQPTTDTQKQIHEIWIRVLNRDDISIRDHFFEIGGTSIHLIKLLTELKKISNKEIKVSDLFSNTSVEKQAILIAEEKVETTKLRLNTVEF